MQCPVCHKDLTHTCAMLGTEPVRFLHRNAHMTEAIEKLLEQSAAWPELYEYFEPLRQALQL